MKGKASLLIPATLLLTLIASRMGDAWRGYEAHGGEIVIWVYVMVGWAIWKGVKKDADQKRH